MKPDGSPLYTVPFIHDTSTGEAIADSILIAEYLEKKYPDTPKLFPNGTAGLQSAFNDGFLANLGTLLPVTYPEMMPYLNSATVAYVAPIVERIRSKNRTEDWIKLKDGMSKIDGWYARNGGKGPYLLGEIPSWADIVVAGWLVFVRHALGEDSKDWKDVGSWNGGRWMTLSDMFRKYELAA
ncbi:hypothetical protein CVT25_000122 [Psilocybe cyanescens]|uniref:GST N-terminal domain-containing protein n=1 Tax=Psilocybe cyanescens TaxID=93625 RepID=A0A409WDY8_PSICY|nr:hypothetical protein CVT25_000122 [Psilocybe cyanescens]